MQFHSLGLVLEIHSEKPSRVLEPVHQIPDPIQVRFYALLLQINSSINA